MLPPAPILRTLFPILILATLAPATAQTWSQQATLPTGWDLDGVWFLSADEGFICGDDRVLMRTTDGGATWAQVGSVSRDRAFYEDEFHDLAFADEQHGWAIGNTNWRTTDGGATWQEMGLIGGTNYEMDAITPDVVYVRSGWNLMKTTDGGQSWFAVFPDEGIDRVNAMDWWDLDRGIFWGGGDQPDSESGLHLTLDGGASWSLVRPGIANDVTFVAPEVLLWHDSFGLTVYRSDDLGQTAAPVLDLVDLPVEIIHRIDADTILVMDAAIRIWISEDAGLTWTQTHGPLGARGLAWPGVHFRDPQNGWIVSEDGLMLQTTDGGTTWTQRNQGIGAELNAIHVDPDGRGLAAGLNGAVIETDDFGTTWTLQPMLFASGGISSDLAHIEVVGGRVYLLNNRGIVYLSNDRGATWTRLENSPYSENTEVFLTDFVDEQTGWMFGRTPIWGMIHRTTDGGQTWTTLMDQYDLEELQLDAQMFDADHGVSVGTGNAFYTTSDGWQTWQEHTITHAQGWQALGFANPDVGWVGSYYGGVAKTTNGGQSWTPVNLPGITTDDRITQIEATSEAEVRILASGGDRVLLYESFDGGQTWQTDDPGLLNPDANLTGAQDFHVAQDGAIWTAGWGGFILAREAQVVGVGDDVAGLPGVPALDGAAPNPFNPATEIAFSLPRSGHVTLVVHDLRGRTVATLVDGQRAAGTHRAHWDGRDDAGRPQSSGLFLARLVWAGGSDSTKLMLVK